MIGILEDKTNPVAKIEFRQIEESIAANNHGSVDFPLPLPKSIQNSPLGIL